MKISPNKEDYIKAIFNLDGASQIVSNKDIANELSVSAASVTDMNTRLVKEGLITHSPYKGVQLTEVGIKISNQLIRKHRIWEVFLYEKLGFQWDEVHEEADRLEHASSDKVIERLDQFLNSPKFDPHGGIIPQADGTVKKFRTPRIPLTEINAGEQFVVLEVPDHDNELLNYLYDKGFSINNRYQLEEINTYDGMIAIQNIDTKEVVTISGKALEKIQVLRLDEDA